MCRSPTRYASRIWHTDVNIIRNRQDSQQSIRTIYRITTRTLRSESQDGPPTPYLTESG